MSVIPELEASPVSDTPWITRIAPAGPHLGVRWTKPRENFRSSLRAVFASPRAPREFAGAPFFRDCWIKPRWPTLAFILALVLESALILGIHPRWNFTRPHPGGPDIQLTWYPPPSDDSAADLPMLSPASPALKRSVRNRAQQPAATRSQSDAGADVFNPRQTIWTQPLAPSHPRQELLEPAAPPTPPKILPVLPNMVQWSDDDSAHPGLKLSPPQLQRMQPARAANKSAGDVAAPDIANQQPAGPIDIAPSANDAPKPAMVVPAMSHGRSGSHGNQGGSAAPAPEIGPSAAGNGGKIIALSETPGPAAPPPSLPQGNLQARISMSPDGRRGAPNGSSGGAANGTGGSDAGSRAGNGPPGIGISRSGDLPDAPVAAISGPSGSGSRRPAYAGDPSPEPRGSNPSAAKTAPREVPGKMAMAPGASPESLLGTHDIYTMHVSMPNLASASGDWALSFAQLNAPEYIPNGRPRPADSALSAPAPIRKVDPKYSEDAQLRKVQGEVVLYAIIRKDGTVDSIQVVHGLDPELDQNSMDALSRWKFGPATRHGDPVDIVAIVHIPFHIPPPEPVY